MMDNVMNRPLFQRYAKNRPATEAMYELSGIMRSSPELIETVQRFQAGGLVRAMGQNLPRQMGTDLAQSAGRAGTRAGAPPAGAVPPGTFTSRANMPPDSIRNIPSQNIGRVMRTAPIVGAGAVGASMLGGEPVDVTREAGSVGLPARPTGSLRSSLRMIDEAEAAGETVDRTKSPVERAQEAADALLADPAARANARDRLGAAAEQDPEIKPVESVVDAVTAPGKTDKERAEDALAAGGREVPSDTKSLIQAYKAMISDVYGVNVERENRLSGLNKALIGFTIAAGDDPRALVNIAKGLAAGSQMAMEREDAKQSREDRIADLAIQQVFAEQAAEKEAARAESLARIRSREGGTSPLDPYAEAVRDVYKTMRSDPLAANMSDDALWEKAQDRVRALPGYAAGLEGPADTGKTYTEAQKQMLSKSRTILERDPSKKAEVISLLEANGLGEGDL